MKMIWVDLLLWISVVLTEDFEDEADNKIVNGQRADWGEFPFAVSLQAQQSHVCGGSLIRPSVVLTACHCITDPTGERVIARSPQLFSVVAGVVSLDLRGASSFREIDVQAVRPHPQCERPNTGWNWDIGLVQTKAPFPLLYNRIEVVAIPRFPNLPENVVSTLSDNKLTCTAIGWGLTNERGRHANPELLKVDLNLHPLNECTSRIEEYALRIGSLNRFRPEAQVCTIGQNGKDACTGDSGGPLTCDTSAFTNITGGERRILFATVSWGIGCARPNVPAGWARLDVTYNWIMNTASALEENSRAILHADSASTKNHVFFSAIIPITIINSIAI